MLRASGRYAAPVYCSVIDVTRLHSSLMSARRVFPIRVELGDGVTSCTPAELQDKLDHMLARSQRFATTRTGNVYNPDETVATTVLAYQRYIVTGNMRGGYIKGDHRYGPRLTGYSGATPKPGLNWNGDDL